MSPKAMDVTASNAERIEHLARAILEIVQSAPDGRKEVIRHLRAAAPQLFGQADE